MGHVDLSRALQGGLKTGFFSLYIPPDPSAPPDGEIVFTADGYEVPIAQPLNRIYAHESAMASLAAVHRLEAAAQGRIRIVRNTGDIERCLTGNTLGIIIHLEGAEAIDRNFDTLQVLYSAGLRSLGIVWSRPNIFGTGVPFRFPHSPDTGPGLTDAGRELVRICNTLGVLIDASHLNERGFWDLAATTQVPLVATHSAVHALCPSSRNLTDKQLDAIRESDGIVGIDFEVSALRSDGNNESNTLLDVLVRHIDHLVQRIGIDRVGFGSDFDGATMSRYLPDASALPNLLIALKRSGYGNEELSKLTHKNWLRVLRMTWCV